MNLIYNIRNRGKIAILLLVIVLLVLASSSAYNDNITRMGDSFSEVYSDRLVVQDYIYKLSDIVHQKRYALADQQKDVSGLNKRLNEQQVKIQQLVLDYEKTQLTPSEHLLFYQFKNNIAKMFALEKRYLEVREQNEKKNLVALQTKSLELSLNQLNKLSEIQLLRGKNLNEGSQKLVSFSALLNQFDWAILIIIGLIIQVLIFASKSTIPRQSGNHSLN